MSLAKTVGTPRTSFNPPTEALGKESQMSPLFQSFIKYSLGNGAPIKFWLDSNHSSFFQYYFPSIYNLSLKSRVSFQILIFLQTGISTSEETLETMKYLNSPPFSPYLPNVILPHLSWIHSRLWSLASLGSFLISSFLQASRPPPLHLSLPTQYGIP